MTLVRRQTTEGEVGGVWYRLQWMSLTWNPLMVCPCPCRSWGLYVLSQTVKLCFARMGHSFRSLEVEARDECLDTQGNRTVS